ncbi:DUF3575 domain-containing protein [Solitalea lacus]|uniref:DUF3575 domain-containing protein n=1 Tax=Solitalea lacus TaxID=2911172 RepID=UPI001EDA4C9C|nr:DUF3575 domain-containing protein [Solitalea lacus]UKJ06073.1 DUF3575 domain-containing protein [Solitalea lacus]
MKKIYALVAALFMAGAAMAQDGPKNAIKVNPLSIGVSTINISYERAAGEKSSFQLGGYYTGYSITDTKWSGFGITPEYRIHLGQSATAIQGFYVAPFLRYQNLKITSPSFDEIGNQSEIKSTLNTFGGGAVIGRQWVWGKFALDIFGGPAFNSGSAKTEGNDAFDIQGANRFKGFTLRFGVSLGLGF